MISITELKNTCKKYGIKGYSKKKKSQIVDMLVEKYASNDDIKRIVLLVKNVKELKKICNELGIRGYSKKKKLHLVETILETQAHKDSIATYIDQFLDANPFPESLLTESILVYCYELIERKNIECSLEEFCQYVSDYETIRKDITKMIYKSIKKQVKNDDDDDDDDGKQQQEEKKQ